MKRLRIFLLPQDGILVHRRGPGPLRANYEPPLHFASTLQGLYVYVAMFKIIIQLTVAQYWRPHDSVAEFRLHQEVFHQCHIVNEPSHQQGLQKPFD